MESSNVKYLTDQESLDGLIARMPIPEQQEYHEYRNRYKLACFPGRKVVVYTLEKGAPAGIEVVTFGGIRMGDDIGPTAGLLDSYGTFTVGLVPTRYRFRDLFLHVPQSLELQWKGQRKSGDEVEYLPHYIVLAKIRHKLPTDGCTYCVTLNVFREQFPGLNLRY